MDSFTSHAVVMNINLALEQIKQDVDALRCNVRLEHGQVQLFSRFVAISGRLF
jgi:hypothetical protein